MSKQYKTTLAILTRDLRINDNLMLKQALDDSESVIPLFVFKEEQIDPGKNDYYSKAAFHFMLESLKSLQGQLRDQDGELFFHRGTYQEVIKQAHEKHRIEAVYVSEDVTPFAQKREKHIQKYCKELDIDFFAVNNHFLTKPGSVLTDYGTPYKVFTPFKNKATEQRVSKPIEVPGSGVWQKTSIFRTGYTHIIDTPDVTTEWIGGRSQALEKLENISSLGEYKTDRDYMSREGTSMLSPHLKFGTLSSREFYHAVAKNFGTGHGLINELYWRDFYAHIVWHNPHVFGNAFNEKYAGIEWDDNPTHLQAWKEGRTGYPIVDAAMRQLNTTGWMHNRARMIVASFLTKHLHIDWKEGERYFAEKLVDYDPATNNGSWQWAASTGADAQPYFRIFNPWSQQEKFDKECEYIKEFVPELRELSPKEIHAYSERDKAPEGYVLPIVDHKTEREEALSRFKSIS